MDNELDLEKEFEREEMPFGRKYRVGNFEVLKVTRSLGRKELNKLREEAGVPFDVRKHLSRGGLPYIIVSDISGSWSIWFVIGSIMYSFIESEIVQESDGGDLSALRNLFTMMFADTTVLGDGDYLKAKMRALKAFMNRIKVRKRGGKVVETEEEKAADDAAMEDVVKMDEALDRIRDMASQIDEPDINQL